MDISLDTNPNKLKVFPVPAIALSLPHYTRNTTNKRRWRQSILQSLKWKSYLSSYNRKPPHCFLVFLVLSTNICRRQCSTCCVAEWIVSLKSEFSYSLYMMQSKGNFTCSRGNSLIKPTARSMRSPFLWLFYLIFAQTIHVFANFSSSINQFRLREVSRILRICPRFPRVLSNRINVNAGKILAALLSLGYSLIMVHKGVKLAKGFAPRLWLTLNYN